jgi:hypothetical protein
MSKKLELFIFLEFYKMNNDDELKYKFLGKKKKSAFF